MTKREQTFSPHFSEHLNDMFQQAKSRRPNAEVEHSSLDKLVEVCSTYEVDPVRVASAIVDRLVAGRTVRLASEVTD